MPRFEDVFVVRQDKSKPYPVWGIYDKQRRNFTPEMGGVLGEALRSRMLPLL